MLLKDFSWPIALANLLVWPLAFLAMRMYLSKFSSPIQLGPRPFVVSLVLVVTTACIAPWVVRRCARRA